LGPGSFGQNVPSMQLPGQLPVSQPLTQQNASAGALHAPSAVQSNPMQPVPGQQLPSNVTPQMLQQPIQQMPSQAPQLLLQQQAALQSSYQSSQQAIFQLQQQLQLMQQQQQQHQQQPNLNQQPHTQVSKQQGQPNQSSGGPAAMMPTNINAIPQQVNSPAVSLTCNWTEHTAPEGFKYYYNSITRESKWEKPEEYVLYEQQQQHQTLILLQHQQKLVAQQLQSPPQAQTIQSIQQHPQSHQGHNQMQMKQQELNYNQLQATGNIDPNRIPQGIQSAQERSWKG